MTARDTPGDRQLDLRRVLFAAKWPEPRGWPRQRRGLVSGGGDGQARGGVEEVQAARVDAQLKPGTGTDVGPGRDTRGP